MQRFRVFPFVFAFCLCWLSPWGTPTHAQERDEWDVHDAELYALGDQIFSITLGGVFPTVFVDGSGGIVKDHNFRPPIGGVISLGYKHFLGANLFVGGDISFAFNNTIAKNTYFVVPFGIYGGWQFVLRRFEFPLSLMFGMAPQRYMDSGYLGVFARGRASAFYRFSPEWSFGLNTDWSWYPQRPMRDGKPFPEGNVDGQMLGVTLSARYHF